MRLLSLMLASLSQTFVVGHPQLPPHLFSPLIAQKLLSTAQLKRYTTRDTGVWRYFDADTWTSGFLPATYYALAERASVCPGTVTVNGTTTAQDTMEVHTTVGHDVGFLSFPFVDELIVNPKNATALQAVETFGAALAARFNPIVGCTRSWDTANPDVFEVIIDNMMTLEVLFNAADVTGNKTLHRIAISHADKTMMNYVRADGSSFHVVDYNATTGALRLLQSSTWSRGQAWGLYGFANTRRMAEYFLENIPADGIVPWDFNAPLIPPRPADSSAAMIAANGLLLLAQQEQSLYPANQSGAEYFTNAAIKSVDSNDTTNAFWAPTWQSLLSNGTVNNRATPPNNLTGIIYGDYYFIKAGNNLVTLGIASCY
ncbi:Six-hairpin glycosidase-like protein [Lactarius quietus]|nr:Six-hairpin glycosidase-like protein [Lactarius quietus]